jgi:hypothetical protein
LAGVVLGFMAITAFTPEIAGAAIAIGVAQAISSCIAAVDANCYIDAALAVPIGAVKPLQEIKSAREILVQFAEIQRWTLSTVKFVVDTGNDYR